MNTPAPTDPQDKPAWLLHGEQLEHEFVALMGVQNPGSRIRINPEKTHRPTAPDLLFGSGMLADLKVQNTPFFKAGRYGLDPRFTWTFNEKDLVRYRRLYPGISIYVWINWRQTSLRIGGQTLQVTPYEAIYRVRLPDLVKRFLDGQMPRHVYQNRGGGEGLYDENGNTVASLLVDMRQFKPLRVLTRQSLRQA